MDEPMSCKNSNLHPINTYREELLFSLYLKIQ